MGTEQEERPPAVAGQHPPRGTQKCGTPIGSRQLHKIGEAAVRQPHSFHDLAVVFLILPDQQMWTSKVVKCGGDYRKWLAHNHRQPDVIEQHLADKREAFQEILQMSDPKRLVAKSGWYPGVRLQ